MVESVSFIFSRLYFINRKYRMLYLNKIILLNFLILNLLLQGFVGVLNTNNTLSNPDTLIISPDITISNSEVDQIIYSDDKVITVSRPSSEDISSKNTSPIETNFSNKSTSLPKDDNYDLDKNTTSSSISLNQFTWISRPNSVVDINDSSTGNTLVWNADTNNEPSNGYDLWRDGTNLVLRGTWNPGSSVSTNLDNLPVGRYAYEIVFWDSLWYELHDSVIVTVHDDTNPQMSSNPSDQIINESNTGNVIQWTATDEYPGNYRILRNSSIIQLGTWSSGNSITYNLNNLVAGYYIYQIIFYDLEGNFVTDTVNITVNDDINPVKIFTPEDINYNVGTSNNKITWSFTDNNPDNYIITRNGTQIASSYWQSNKNITINVDSLAPSTYLYQIITYDKVGRSNSDTVLVTVSDPFSPIITTPSNIVYEEGTITNYELTWSVYDHYPSLYLVKRNGSTILTGGWVNGSIITVNVNGLTLGVYEYFIELLDTSGNKVNDTKWVTVTDTSAPIFLEIPSDLVYIEGSTLNSLSWKGSDNHPRNYAIYRNNSLLISGGWINNTVFQINVDNLQRGYYEYKIWIYDVNNNYAVDIVIVNVIDNIKPIFTSIPADFYYASSSTGNTITWIATDLHPDFYVIKRNGDIIYSNTWTSTGTISINVDGLGVATHNYTIIVYDDSGNFEIDMVNVTVSNFPIINDAPTDIFYIYGDTGNQLSWTISDTDADKYKIYQDDVIVQSGTWSNAVPITRNIDGLFYGTYNFTLYINDTSSNIVTDIVWVTVSDVPVFSEQPVSFTYDEGSGGFTLIWNATDRAPDTFIIYEDGVIRNSTTWSNSSRMTFHVSDLSIGVYNFSIFVNDTLNNFITHSILVTSQDITNPIIITTPTLNNYNENTTGYYLNWSATDLHSDYYIIRRNGSIIVPSTTWTSGSLLSLNIDGLMAGLHVYNITFYDTSGNKASMLHNVIVYDVDGPINTISPTSFINLSEGLTTILTWQFIDLHSSFYEIYRDNITLVQSGSWSNNLNISYTTNAGLSLGLFNFTIYVNDTSGNWSNDTVFVNIIDITNPTFPYGTPNDIVNTEGQLGTTSFSWAFEENHPDWLIVSRNGINNVSMSYVGLSSLQVNLTGLSLGTHIYVITLNDTSGNFVSDTVVVIIREITPPTLIISPTNTSYEEFTSTDIIFQAFDNYNNTYVLKYNVTGEILTTYTSGSWNQNQNVTITISGFSIGYYNFTLFIYDDSMNVRTHWFIVWVYDTTLPNINYQTSDHVYESGSTSNIIQWNGSDANADFYRLYKNGDYLGQYTWTNNFNHSLNVDNLAIGVYNYTIVLFDTSNNFRVITVWITVQDTIIPVFLVSPSNFTITELQENENLVFQGFDLNGAYYQIYRNGELILTNPSWPNNVDLTYPIGIRNKGIYNYTIILFDTTGNMKIHTIWLTVIDSINPNFITQATSITYTEGTEGHLLSWSAFDKYEGRYELYRNGSLVAQNNWVSNVVFTHNIDNLAKGWYVFTIHLFDGSENSISYFLIVTVIDETNPDIVVNPLDTSYFEDTTDNFITWEFYDLYPNNFTVLLNGDYYNDGFWTNDNLSISIDGLIFGEYNFTIIVSDKSNNFTNDTVIITVIDNIYPIFHSVPADEVTVLEGT
ncbi:MAG: hypothetical protein OEY49_09730, partial [Candidatus Heimdallarchaeota archaeon]|nr:hypothetical protein [Candidatus Heimdallarchaeota archaeon]